MDKGEEGDQRIHGKNVWRKKWTYLASSTARGGLMQQSKKKPDRRSGCDLCSTGGVILTYIQFLGAESLTLLTQTLKGYFPFSLMDRCLYSHLCNVRESCTESLDLVSIIRLWSLTVSSAPAWQGRPLASEYILRNTNSPATQILVDSRQFITWLWVSIRWPRCCHLPASCRHVTWHIAISLISSSWMNRIICLHVLQRKSFSDLSC